MSEEVRQRVFHFLMHNTFNTPGHVSKCRSRRANHKTGEVMYCACESVCVCVCVYSGTKQSKWGLLVTEILTCRTSQLHVGFNDLICSSTSRRSCFKPVRRHSLQYISQHGSLLFYRFMLYHPIFFRETFKQDIAEGDGLKVSKTSRLTRNLRDQLQCGGAREAWAGRQTQLYLSGWPVGAP